MQIRAICPQQKLLVYVRKKPSPSLSWLSFYLRVKLFGGTVPSPKTPIWRYCTSTKKLFGGTIPPNNFFGGGTLMEISFW